MEKLTDQNLLFLQIADSPEIALSKTYSIANYGNVWQHDLWVRTW